MVGGEKGTCYNCTLGEPPVQQGMHRLAPVTFNNRTSLPAGKCSIFSRIHDTGNIITAQCITHKHASTDSCTVKVLCCKHVTQTRCFLFIGKLQFPWQYTGIIYLTETSKHCSRQMMHGQSWVKCQRDIEWLHGNVRMRIQEWCSPLPNQNKYQSVQKYRKKSSTPQSPSCPR